LERVCATTRIETRAPQRFGRVDVAEASDNALIEEGHFDRYASSGQRIAKIFRSQRRICGLRTQSELRRCAGRVNVEGRERTGVIEHHPGAGREVDDDASESRQRIVRATDLPVAVHPEVHVHHPTIIEVDQLMLSTSLDITHTGASQRSQHARRYAAPQRGVRELDALDGCSLHRASQ
jgi:hypothetical protein